MHKKMTINANLRPFIIINSFFVLLSSFLFGQCEGSPNDSTFDYNLCDTVDINVLNNFIYLNNLTEETTLYDYNDGDGELEFFELGLQEWSYGRLKSLLINFVNDNVWGGAWADYNLSIIPNNISNLDSLTILDLNDNNLTILPETIGDIENLIELHVGFNQLNSIPENIGNLSNLTYLYLRGCQLDYLPENIGNLSSLTHLIIDDNQLTELPESIGNLIYLRAINISFNNISTLPLSFWNLTNLLGIYMGSNNFTSLPEEIGNLTNLTLLDVGFNQLTNLPEAIGSLEPVESLGIHFNQLTTLPENICNLTNLSVFYMQGNYLYCENGIQNISLIPPCLIEWQDQSIIYGLYDQDCSVISISDYSSPFNYDLKLPYPNPFNNQISLQFSIPITEWIKLSIYDINGRELESIIDRKMEKGINHVSWIANNIPSGMYLIKMESYNFNKTQKILLLK